MSEGFQFTNQGDFVTTLPGPVIRAVLQRGQTGYNYDDIDGILYVENSGDVYRIKRYSDGDYGYAAKGGGDNIRTIPRNGAQIVSHGELEDLLKKHREGKL